MEQPQVLLSFFDGLRPELRYTVSEWADKHRYLSSEASAEPGQWRTSRVPYMKEIMDAMSVNSPIQEVTLDERGASSGNRGCMQCSRVLY